MGNHLKLCERFSAAKEVIYLSILIAFLFLCQPANAYDCMVNTELQSRALKAKAALLAAATIKTLMNSVSISQACNGATNLETEKFRQTIEAMPKNINV